MPTKQFYLRSARLLMIMFYLITQAQAIAQDKNVRITVIDSASKITLPGVNVAIKGTTRGGATDVDGRLSLQVAGDEILVISFIGYEKQEIVAGSWSEIEVALRASQTMLDELVVIGYGTQKRSELTGAVTSVKADEIQKVPTNSFTSSLQGKIPGVFINQTSGAPGGAASVRIRGVGTTGGNQPLYVVDGMIGHIEQ